MTTTERTIIGDERVAEIHDERGSSLNAAIHRLTPEQAVVALMWLAGAHPESTAKAIARATELIGPLAELEASDA